MDSELTNADPSPDEAMVPAFSSSNHDAESEALIVKGILDANGIPAIVAGPTILPNLEFQVQVPEHLLGEAQRLIDEARQAGSSAAVEAERASEGGPEA
ncbi:MAG TPA: hypothetical protein VKB79_10950 [Bryobacteraceae bacterium]|nr:hypothetical protein [Bryobacteraceae bacterium]